MKAPEYKKYEDGVDYLKCKIIVWDQADNSKIDTSDPPVDKCLTFRECVNIEIDESYKKLIGTAKVTFARSMVVKTFSDKEETDTKVYAERMADGAIAERRQGASLLKPSQFQVGNRIRIYLGYYKDTGVNINKGSAQEFDDEEVFNTNIPDFDGFITKVSASSPVELTCENLAYFLKRKNCPNIKTGLHATVNDFLASDGKYKLLNGTGLELDDDTKNCNIDIGQAVISNELTVADVLTEWAKNKLYCFVRYNQDGVPKLKVGRSYFSTKTKESIVNDNGCSDIPVIQFDYHVANDGLKAINTDPKKLAVSAEGFQFKNGKEVKLSITLTLNPDWKGSSDTEHEKFKVYSQVRLSKKSMKFAAISKETTQSKNLSDYTIIPYTSSKIGITEEGLIKEAEAYFEGYNMNGIEGELTIFGDMHNTNLGRSHIQSGMKVGLYDKRCPEKNGWYLVEEVHTTFGANGFRQRLKLPYCIAKPENNETKSTAK